MLVDNKIEESYRKYFSYFSLHVGCYLCYSKLFFFMKFVLWQHLNVVRNFLQGCEKFLQYHNSLSEKLLHSVLSICHWKIRKNIFWICLMCVYHVFFSTVFCYWVSHIPKNPKTKTNFTQNILDAKILFFFCLEFLLQCTLRNKLFKMNLICKCSNKSPYKNHFVWRNNYGNKIIDIF